MGIPEQVFQICIGFNSDKNYILMNKIENFMQINPNCEFNLITNYEQLDEFIRSECSPSVQEAYSRIKDSYSKIEFCKYLILYEQGGIYLDASADFINLELDPILRTEDRGIIIRASETNLYSNAFMAFCPNHPILERTIGLMIKYINNETFSESLDYTIGDEDSKNESGISAFSKAVKIEHFNIYNKNLIWNRVKPDDVLTFNNRALPYRLFGSWTKFIESGK
jgi:mannosyltransferase OCH1-like enzyme